MIDCLADYLCNQNINGCIHDDCDNPMFSGIESRAFIFNKSDIEGFAVDPNNSNMINDIILKQGAKGYGIVNVRNNPFTGTNTQVVTGDFRNTFTRTVSFFVPMDGAEVVKNIIDPLANGSFVMVLKNQFVNANQDNEYMIFGVDRGLKISGDGGSLQQTKYENNDYWIVELQETGVPTADKFFSYTGGERYEDVETIRYNGEELPVSALDFTKDNDGNFYMRYTSADGIETFTTAIETVSSHEADFDVKFGNNTYRFSFESTFDSWMVGDYVVPTMASILVPGDTGAYLCSLVEC